MTDNDFQQTKRVLLGQESMNKEYAQLAEFIQERFSVQVINVICAKGEDSINLTLWFKYENEVNYFYKGRFVVDSRKRNTILNKFKQIANIENKADSIYLSYQAFETLAKEEANNSITQLEILELKEKLHCNDLWDISRCLANVVFFLYEDKQVRQYKERGFIDIWSEMYLGLLNRYDEFGFFTKENFHVKLDSKENFDTNFNSNWLVLLLCIKMCITSTCSALTAASCNPLSVHKKNKKQNMN